MREKMNNHYCGMGVSITINACNLGFFPCAPMDPINHAISHSSLAIQMTPFMGFGLGAEVNFFKGLILLYHANLAKYRLMKKTAM